MASTALKFFIATSLLSGCSYSTTPTYLQRNIEKAIHNICLNEYQTFVVVKRVGRTIWIYIPIEDMFEKSEKPEKFSEHHECESSA